MRYVNKYLDKEAFVFEELKDMAVMADKGDDAVSYDLTSGYCHVGSHLSTRTFVGFAGGGTSFTTAYRSDRLRPLGSFKKSRGNW
jgi:hypothetical protein